METLLNVIPLKLAGLLGLNFDDLYELSKFNANDRVRLMLTKVGIKTRKGFINIPQVQSEEFEDYTERELIYHLAHIGKRSESVEDFLSSIEKYMERAFTVNKHTYENLKPTDGLQKAATSLLKIKLSKQYSQAELLEVVTLLFLAQKGI
jgi:hypothetical protein